MKLTNQRFSQAVEFLKSSARPLDKALYRYHFEGGSATDVLVELAHFQNSDGGFGHALEPDIRLADSSVIATTLAFQHFREIAAPVDHPMVVQAARYFLAGYDAEHLNWSIIPPNVDDAPHAPWWVHNGDLEKSRSNPRAEIAGYLHEYPQHFPADMREKVTQSVMDYLLSASDELEMHDLFCYLRLSESPNLPESIRKPLMAKLQQVINHTVERDPKQWQNYGLPPLAVIASPASPFAEAFQAEIQANLDFIIESQDADGTWTPSWSWGGQWEETWAQAKQDWTGRITLDNLCKLRAFGRIENE